MNKQIVTDLADITDALEHLSRRLPTLSREEKVDVAARMRAVAKHADLIDEYVKGEIKAWRKGKEGYVLGEVFKAWLGLVEATRLDQTKLKVEYPKVHEACLKKSTDTRITFEPR